MSLNEQNVLSPSARGAELTESVFKVPNTLSRRYGFAFYRYLAEQNLVSEVLPQVYAFRKVLQNDDALQDFVQDLALNNTVRAEVLSSLAKDGQIHSAFTTFLMVVVKRGRLSILSEILAAVLYLADKEAGIVPVGVTTPLAMDEGQRQVLRSSLEKMGYESPRIFEKVDPSLLGGAMVQVGFLVFDTSLKGRVSRLKHAFEGEV